MEAVHITDLNIKYVNLPHGKWIVDGEVATGNQKTPVKDFENIRKITERQIVSYYICGDLKLTVEEYTEQKYELLKNKVDDEWKDLESEFQFRKFLELWQPVYNLLEEISEPISFPEIKERVINTGNPYITSEFAEGKDTNLFNYRQEAAYIGIVHEAFKELEMEFKDKIDYHQTARKKIWGNSDHSGIRYATAFGTYVFNDAFQTRGLIRGTLKESLARYEADKLKIRKVIFNKYNEHFGAIDAKNFNFDFLLGRLRAVKCNLKRDDFKKSGESSYSVIVKNINEAITLLEESYKTKE